MLNGMDKPWFILFQENITTYLAETYQSFSYNDIFILIKIIRLKQAYFKLMMIRIPSHIVAVFVESTRTIHLEWFCMALFVHLYASSASYFHYFEQMTVICIFSTSA